MVKTAQITIEVEVYDELSSLSPQEQMLMQKAREATALAYAPYSKFSVGAAVLLDDGTVVLGSNQENAAYPSGLCAERVALFHMGAAHGHGKAIAIAVAAKSEHQDAHCAVTPCGACRQVMLEQEHRQGLPMMVLLPSANGGVYKVKSAQDLLPLKFNAESLLP